MDDWRTYVRRTVGDGITQVDIAQRTGVDQTTISRWLSGGSRARTPDMVGRFARAYGRPVLEAFVYAGLISEGDARVRVIKPRTLDGFTLDELLREVTARTSRGVDAS